MNYTLDNQILRRPSRTTSDMADVTASRTATGASGGEFHDGRVIGPRGSRKYVCAATCMN